MGILETIYDHSPLFMQNVMCSVAGAGKYKKRYKGVYRKVREFCKEFDSWDIERQKDYQNAKLVEFIRYAAEKSPFYAELYSKVSLDEIKCPYDLPKLPVVDKEMLRANMDRVFTIPKKGALVGHTGGTTGKSLTVRSTVEDSETRMAILDHFKSRVGFENLKMKRATFNGKHIIPPKQKSHIYWRYNAPMKQMIYSSFHLTEDKIGYYVDSLNEFKPQAIDGFFTAICDIANYMERHDINPSFKPVAIFPTSETLTDEGRKLIERVFGCKVYDQYASSEGAPFVTECINQTLHMELNTGVFECMPNGEILVTSFTTHGTPLIRYAIGDKMEFAPCGSKCDCGLCGPIVKKIEGRRLDFLYRPDGAKLNAGIVSNLLKYLPNSVIRSQFVQERMDQVTILLEVDKRLFDEKATQGILDECRHTFGEDMKVEIKVVDEIPRATSGKFRMIINKVV